MVRSSTPPDARPGFSPIDLERPHSGLWSTAGCHPTSTTEIEKHAGGVDAYLSELESVIKEELAAGSDSRLVAIGEIGLGNADRTGGCTTNHLFVLADAGFSYRQITTDCTTRQRKPNSLTFPACSPSRRNTTSRCSCTPATPTHTPTSCGS
jgi:hypothetical protein